MDEKIFWIWNGWGILFTFGLVLWQYLHLYFTNLYGATPIKRWITPLFIVCLPCVFIFNGWIAGFLALPIAQAVGLCFLKFMKLFKNSK